MASPLPRRLRVVLLALSASLAACDCGGEFDPRIPPWKADAGTSVCTPPFLGTGTVLATGFDVPRKLAADGTHLYFTEAGAVGTARVFRVPLAIPDAGLPDGGLAEEIAAGFSAADGIAVDEAYVYFLDEDGLWRANKETRQVTKLDDLASNALNAESEIQLHAETLIIATGLEWLVRINKDGTERTVLHAATPGAAVRDVVVEGDQAFFLVSATGDAVPAAGLYRVPVDGSSPAVQLSATPVLGRDLTLTAEAFVWTEGSAARDGAIRALSRSDGGTFTYADQLWSPTAPVVIDPFVYFHARTDPSPNNPPTELFFRMASTCDPLGAPIVGPTGFGPGDLLLRDGTLYFTSLGAAGQGFVAKLP